VKEYNTTEKPLVKGLWLAGDTPITLDMSEVLVDEYVTPTMLQNAKAIIVTNSSLYNHTMDLCRQRNIMAIAVNHLVQIEDIKGLVTIAPNGNIYEGKVEFTN
jgi:hypothetical protein